MLDEISKIEEKIVDRVGSYEFGPKILSKLINKSTSTLQRWRDNSKYIEFKKLGSAKNAAIVYTARAVAIYLLKQENKVVDYD